MSNSHHQPRTAETVVRAHLLGVLPPGVPPGFKALEAAHFEGQGRCRVAVAEVTMLDGLKATVEVFGWAKHAKGHRWRSWEGAAWLFEGGVWTREAPDA